MRQPSSYLALLLLMAAAGLPAQEPDSVAYPPAYPREGTTQLLANAWGTVWDVTWVPDQPTAMHRHVYDNVGVELVESRTRLVSPDSQARVATLRRGRVWFNERGVTHYEVALTRDPSRHAVIIDIAETASPIIENRTTFPEGPPTADAVMLIDNERVVVWDCTWIEGRSSPTQFFGRNAFVIFLDGGEVEWTAPDEPGRTITVTTGQVLFSAAGARAVQAINGDVRAIIVELK